MDKDNLWTRRANSNNKLSLSTPGGATSQGEGFGRSNASFSRRFGGDTSSHGNKTGNPFNTTTSAASLASPTSASSAFGLGSGAFASFGSAKTPKTPGNPFDLAMKGSLGSTTPAATPGGKGAATPTAATPKAAASATKAGKELPERHPTRHQWTFWHRPPINKSNGNQLEYEKTLKKQNDKPIASVEDFFDIYLYLKFPSKLAQMSDYYLFKDGIPPLWEDEANRKGGKWSIRIKKGVADRLWENLCLAMVGDQFAEASEEVCGAVMNNRNGEDVISIWTATNGGRNIKIRETMKRMLELPTETKIEWKSHDASMQQRTAVEESRREKASNNNHNDRRKMSSQHGNSQLKQHDQPKQANAGPS